MNGCSENKRTINAYYNLFSRSYLMESDKDLLYDVVVIGAGIVGSSTAYSIAKEGVRHVALLEQFQLGHTRGSSHGGSRITRRGYHTHYYAEMMTEAFKLWEEVEQEYGTQLYVKTGGFHFGNATSKYVKEVISGFQHLRVKHEVLSSTEANDRFEFFQLPSDYRCVIEEDAGILAASKTVHALQTLFTKRGGKIFDCCQVTKVIPGGDVVTIATTKGDFKTKKVVITAGPYSSKILKPLGIDLPLVVKRLEVCYWKTDLPNICSAGYSHSDDHSMGVFMYSDDVNDQEGYYGLPAYEYPGLVKICLTGQTVVDPDHRDADLASHSTTASVSQFIGKFFKGISTTPSIVEPCMCTYSPDYDFFLDYHPDYHNIIIGTGFSGHGFKLAPVIGKILAELTLSLSPSYDLQYFKLHRFQKT